MSKFIILDGSYQVFRHIHSSIMDELFSPKYVAFRVMRTILKEITQYSASPIICFDKHSSKFRKQIYPDYKGQRYSDDKDVIVFDEKSPPELRGKVISDFNIDIDKLVEYFNIIKMLDGIDEKYKEAVTDAVRLRTYLYVRDLYTTLSANLGILTLTLSGYEADDIANFFSNHITGTGRLVSDDKDWMISVNDRYELYRPMAETLITVDTIKEKYPDLCKVVTPGEAVRLVKTIVGDSSDNIPGFEGIGEVRGLSLLKEMLSDGKINPGKLLSIEDNIKYLVKKTNEGLFNENSLLDREIYNQVKNNGYITENNEFNLAVEDYEKYLKSEIKLPKFKQSLINNWDRFELNYKLVGFDHLGETETKNELFTLIKNEADKVQKISQLKYIQFCSSISSQTLLDNYPLLSSNLDYESIKNINLV